MRQTLDPGDPANTCYGCGPTNPLGLRLAFRPVGDAGVEADFRADAALCGSRGVLHGGVAAALLDEVMGAALTRVVAHDRPAVTAELAVRFRRPAPIGAPLAVRAAVDRFEGADLHLVGEILDAAGELLVEARARWRVLDDR